MKTESELRWLIKDAGVQMLAENLVQGTWGNISVRIDEKHMLCTPSGLDYVDLTVDDMSVVDIDTLEWVGSKKPTSERKIHAAILRDRPEINVVLHSHPSECSVFASARKDLPITNPELKELLGGDIRCAKYALPGTKGLCKNTVEAMKGRKGCFLANHGVFACGESMDLAFEAIRAMEKGCRDYIEAQTAKALGKSSYGVGDDVVLFLKK